MLNGSVRLRHRDNHTLFMNENIVEIRHKTGTTIRVENDGTVSINASNDIVNIDGNTTITGTLHVTDAQTNDSTITASGEITSGSVTLTGHTHNDTPGLGAGTTTTGSG